MGFDGHFAFQREGPDVDPFVRHDDFDVDLAVNFCGIAMEM